MHDLINKIASCDIIDAAYEWLCQRRQKYSPNSDIWNLRRAVKKVNQVLASLNLKKHPDKTFVGRAEKGFDFLGYRFTPGTLTVAVKTAKRFVERAARLYEQETRKEP